MRMMLGDIKVDMRINVRDVDTALVNAYQADMQRYGETDWQAHWKEALKIVAEGFLYGGFHTYAAALAEFGETHSVTVHVEGETWKDAYALACGENATHGKRRTNKEKRAAIERLLLDDDFKIWANGYIADMTKTSIGLVMSVEKELAEKQPAWKRPQTRRRISGVGVATCPGKASVNPSSLNGTGEKGSQAAQAIADIHEDRNAAWDDVKRVYEAQAVFKYIAFPAFLERVHAAKPPTDTEVTLEVLVAPVTRAQDAFSHNAIIRAAVYLRSLIGVLQTQHPPVWFQNVLENVNTLNAKTEAAFAQPVDSDAPAPAIAVEVEELPATESTTAPAHEETLPATFVAVVDTLEKLTAHNFIAGYQAVLQPAEETAGNTDGEWAGEVFETINALQATLATLEAQQQLVLALLKAYKPPETEVPDGERITLTTAFCD